MRKNGAIHSSPATDSCHWPNANCVPGPVLSPLSGGRETKKKKTRYKLLQVLRYFTPSKCALSSSNSCHISSASPLRANSKSPFENLPCFHLHHDHLDRQLRLPSNLYSLGLASPPTKAPSCLLLVSPSWLTHRPLSYHLININLTPYLHEQLIQSITTGPTSL